MTFHFLGLSSSALKAGNFNNETRRRGKNGNRKEERGGEREEEAERRKKGRNTSISITTGIVLSNFVLCFCQINGEEC